MSKILKVSLALLVAHASASAKPKSVAQCRAEQQKSGARQRSLIEYGIGDSSKPEKSGHAGKRKAAPTSTGSKKPRTAGSEKKSSAFSREDREQGAGQGAASAVSQQERKKPEDSSRKRKRSSADSEDESSSGRDAGDTTRASSPKPAPPNIVGAKNCGTKKNRGIGSSAGQGATVAGSSKRFLAGRVPKPSPGPNRRPDARSDRLRAAVIRIIDVERVTVDDKSCWVGSGKQSSSIRVNVADRQGGTKTMVMKVFRGVGFRCEYDAECDLGATMQASPHIIKPHALVNRRYQTRSNVADPHFVDLPIAQFLANCSRSDTDAPALLGQYIVSQTFGPYEIVGDVVAIVKCTAAEKTFSEHTILYQTSKPQRGDDLGIVTINCRVIDNGKKVQWTSVFSSVLGGCSGWVQSLPGESKVKRLLKHLVIHSARSANSGSHFSLCGIENPSTGELSVGPVDKLKFRSDQLLLFDYMGKGNLYNQIEAGAMTPEAMFQSHLSVVQGLVAFHKDRKSHNDIKPENVLVNADGQVFVADLVAAGTIGTGFHGLPTTYTPSYASPESVRYAYDMEQWDKVREKPNKWLEHAEQYMHFDRAKHDVFGVGAMLSTCLAKKKKKGLFLDTKIGRDGKPQVNNFRDEKVEEQFGILLNQKCTSNVLT